MPENSRQRDPEVASVVKWLTGGWAQSFVVLALLVVAFYVEEDWRGEGDWKQAQADVRAKGESLDPAKFFPAQVSDEQNFGNLPIFQTAVDSTGHRAAAGINRAFANISSNGIPYSKDEETKPGDLPYAGRWMKGDEVDLQEIRKKLAACCALRLKEIHLSPDETSVAMFGRLCPALAELRSANESHPLCRFDLFDKKSSPMNQSWGALTSQIKLANFLTYEERLALLEGQPGIAADDLAITWKIASGLREQPTLIAGLVYNGVVAIQLGVVSEGLAKHVWTDQELTDMDEALGKIDCLAETQSCVRSEMAVMSVPTYEFLKANRMELRTIMTGSFGPLSAPSTLSEDLSYLLFFCGAEAIPNGWFDEFESASVRFNLLGVVQMVDPVAHRAYPEKEKTARALVAPSRAATSSVFSEFIYFALPSVRRFSFAQAQVDEARIACRLERYRLLHGQYPTTLADLGPLSGGGLPHDVMTGAPYHYKVQPDGLYLLYSVGWNQVDDGGDRHLPRYTATSETDDWVWPNVPVAPITK